MGPYSFIEQAPDRSDAQKKLHPSKCFTFSDFFSLAKASSALVHIGHKRTKVILI